MLDASDDEEEMEDLPPRSVLPQKRWLRSPGSAEPLLPS